MALIQAFLVPNVTTDTTTTTFDFPDPQVAQANPKNTESQMPWAGKIRRIWLGHSNTIGDGQVQIIRYAGGLSSAATNLAAVNYTGTAGAFTEIIEYDEDFIKDDGIQIRVIRNTDISSITLTITLEVEFTLI